MMADQLADEQADGLTPARLLHDAILRAGQLKVSHIAPRLQERPAEAPDDWLAVTCEELGPWWIVWSGEKFIWVANPARTAPLPAISDVIGTLDDLDQAAVNVERTMRARLASVRARAAAAARKANEDLAKLRADFTDWEFSLHRDGPHTWVAQRYPGRQGTFVTRIVSDDADQLRAALIGCMAFDRPTGSSA